MTRVMISGVSGFAGSHVLEHFLANTDWDVIGIASWKHKGTPERVEEVLKGDKSWKDRLTIITHDLVSPFTDRTKKRIGQCDYIINLAAESHVDRSITEPVTFVKNNVDLMLTMLEFAREYKPKMFLQFSTDEIYGVAPEGVNHKEWSSVVPSNPYSASKAAQEAVAISYWRTYSVPVVITNTMNLFGEMQDSEKFIAKTIKAVLNGDVMTVHGRPGRIGSRYYLHARNMADAVLFITKEVTPTLYKDGEDILPDRFNIVGDIELNNLEMAKLVANICGKELKYELVDFHTALRPGHDFRYALDGTKLRELGWTAPLDFKESMHKYVDWTKENTIWM